MKEGITGIWKFDKITGYWQLEHKCAIDESPRWLQLWQETEPGEVLRVSRKKPRRPKNRQEAWAWIDQAQADKTTA